jgi:hypothetical protein
MTWCCAPLASIVGSGPRDASPWPPGRASFGPPLIPATGQILGPPRRPPASLPNISPLPPERYRRSRWRMRASPHRCVAGAWLRGREATPAKHATLYKLLDWLAPSMLPEDRRFWKSQWDDHQLELFQDFKASVKALETDASTPLPKIEAAQEVKAPPARAAAPAPRLPDGVNRYGGRVG